MRGGEENGEIEAVELTLPVLAFAEFGVQTFAQLCQIVCILLYRPKLDQGQPGPFSRKQFPKGIAILRLG